MCGIIGILKTNRSEETISEIVSALKKMEYRGYDSWGYAFINDSLKLEKKSGRITQQSMKEKTIIGIGHTRWATHGGVTDQNAHPHTDCKNEIAIIHNGIIENYLEIKNQLMEKGHKFRSETDTEVIAHMFEEEHGNLLEKAKKVAMKLKGAFGIVAIDKNNTNEMVAIKHECPIIVGVGKDRAIFASDPLAFLEYTNEAIFLEEGDIAYAKRNGTINFEFFNYLDNKKVDRKPKEISWKSEESELKGHPHYMLKEIMEQPKVMRKAIDLDVAKKMAGEMKGRKVIAIACGTARHAAIIGKHLLNRIAKYQLEVMMAHEFTNFIDDLDAGTLILAVSQSGETADVLECVRKAKKRGLDILSIVNVPSSTLARESKIVFNTNCGPEIAVASTKAFTNQVMAFYQIAFEMKGISPELEGIIKILEDNMVYFDEKAKEVAEYLKTKQHVYMLGKGVNLAMALEGALKLKEISYIHAEGMPSGELKHGTLALIEKGTPVLLLCPTDYTYSDSINNGLETRARESFLIGMSDKQHPSFDIWIKLPKLENDIFYPLLEAIPLQLIAYHSAVLLGRDVDKPRNLAKSVTVK
ncbi:MAG: glutamine--fructose-6-phosphate transaminase (isomerizing) [Candidatus Micrarchaeota archaeon]